MTLLRDLRRCGARVLAPLVAVAALLAACGGGTSQVESFVPARLLVLGDETNMLVDDGTHDGFKYSVNDRTGTSTGKCLLQPTIAQLVASHYGMVFAACNSSTAEAKASILAQAGAQVDDSSSGLQAQVTGISALGKTDMVLMMIGANDMIALYEKKLAGELTADAATTEAKRRGALVAAQINRVLATGARALVVTVPDMGRSPYAIQANVSDPGSSGNPGAAELLGTLTTAYNTAMRLGVDSNAYDGRNYGLVLADDVVAAIIKYPSSYLSSPSNITEAVCTLASMPQGCLVVTDATAPAVNVSASTHLWASDRHLGPVAHLQIGSEAVSRASDNPF